MKRILFTAGVPLLLLAAADLTAQSPGAAGIAPGTRVRVTSLDAEKRLTGGVAFADADSLVLTTGDGRTMVPTASIQRLDVSAGRDWRKGAVKGAVIGTLAGGAVLGGLMAAESGDTEWTGVAVVLGAVVGAPTGLIVGGIVGSERWVPHHRAAAPQATGVALGFTIPLL